MRVSGLLLVLLSALAVAGEARAEDVADLVSGPAYEARDAFPVQGGSAQGFVPRDGSSGRPFWFLLRGEGEAEWTRAYRVTRTEDGSEAGRLDVFLLDPRSDPASDATRVRAAGTSGQGVYETAARLVGEVEAAAPDWQAHAGEIARAYGRSSEDAREAWRRVVRSLEGARDAHPDHLGILQDLIVAYTQLNAYERGTTYGVNLARLLPDRLDELERAVGTPTTDEARLLRRARAFYYFECGLHPLARAAVEEGDGDPELASLGRVLERLGQSEFATRETFEVRGEIAAYEVSVRETLSRPPAGALLHDELYFLTRPAGSASPVGRVWYALSSQSIDGTPRYYLYGCTGGTRSLLRMYGHERPEDARVRQDVEEAMQRGLARPRPQEGGLGFGAALLGLWAVLVLLAALAVVLRRRPAPASGRARIRP